MSHKLWDKLLAQYFTGTLSGRDRARFDRHLQDCETCRAEFDGWQAIAAAVKQDADARMDDLPPLPAAFYGRLGVQPSANGSLQHPAADREENMTMYTDYAGVRKSHSRPVTWAAAVTVLFLGGLLWLAGQGGAPGPTIQPLAGVVNQEATPTPPPLDILDTAAPVPGMDSAFLTATAMIEGATATAQAHLGMIPLITATLVPGTDLPLAFGELIVPSPLAITATPIAVEVFEMPPTVDPPAPPVSAMQPIISAPARLMNTFEIPLQIRVSDVFLSPDGMWLALLFANGSVNLFDAATLEVAMTIDGMNVAHLAFSPDSQWLALGRRDGDIALVDLKAREMDRTLDGDGTVSGLVFSPHSGQLLIWRDTSNMSVLWLYSLQTEEQAAIFIYDVPLAGAAFNADGSRVAAAALDGRVVTLDVSQAGR